MRTAEYMFKELGYNLVRKDDDYIMYEEKLDGYVTVVSFCNQLQNVKLYYESLKYHQTPSIDMQLFRAIEKQLKELDWIS